MEAALAAVAAAEVACIEVEDTPEKEQERAAEAHGHAEAGGKDPSTERQIKYVAGKFASWLSLHGEAHGHTEGSSLSKRERFRTDIFHAHPHLMRRRINGPRCVSCEIDFSSVMNRGKGPFFLAASGRQATLGSRKWK